MYSPKWNADPIELIHFADDDGCLCPLEFDGLPFMPVRSFFVSNVPAGTTRGNHAHFKTEQLLICLSGQLKIKLTDGVSQVEHVLKPHQMVYAPNLIWDSVTFITGSDLLLVLCSTNYNKDDYIENWGQFKSIVETTS